MQGKKVPEAGDSDPPVPSTSLVIKLCLFDRMKQLHIDGRNISSGSKGGCAPPPSIFGFFFSQKQSCEQKISIKRVRNMSKKRNCRFRDILGRACPQTPYKACACVVPPPPPPRFENPGSAPEHRTPYS